MNNFLILIVLIFNCPDTNAQSISGNMTHSSGQTIKLEAFKGFNTYTVSDCMVDDKGNFLLPYSKSDYGIGYLMSSNQKSLIVILSGEDIEIQGEALINTESIRILKGSENQRFAQYATEQPRREQAINVWNYLEKIYMTDSLFSSQNKARQTIHSEIQRIKNTDSDFLNNLPAESYLRWYLPTRKFVSSVSVVAQYRPEELLTTVEEFRNMDYTDHRLYRSGLLKDAIESHFWLLENSGRSLDSVFTEMKISIDAMMSFLVKDEKKLNEITDYLFNLLERHSLFSASEYLALKALNEVSCTIDGNLAKQLETYRAMKKGNTAPDISFEEGLMSPSPSGQPKWLSDIKSKYTLVVFGAGWCPKCRNDIPEIAALYPKWKSQDVEVVFISLDDDKNDFMDIAGKLPFISYCDLKKWKSPVAENYYIFATPTMFLLDNKREILLRPNSVNQVDAWVDWFLIQGSHKKD